MVWAFLIVCKFMFEFYSFFFVLDNSPISLYTSQNQNMVKYLDAYGTIEKNWK